MALTEKLSTEAVNALADVLNTQLSNGSMEIRSGTQPPTVNDAPSGGIVLATLNFGSPLFDAPVAGVLQTFNPIFTFAADATGTASWFRMYDQFGVAQIDGSVGTSGCNLNINTTSIVVGAEVVIEVPLTIILNKE